MHEDYYLKQERKLVRNFVRLTHRNKVVFDKYCNGNVDSIQDETISNFKMLLPELPYIGGKENSQTRSFIGSLQLLALIKTLKDHVVSKEEIGEFIFRLAENEVKRHNRLVLNIARMMFFSRRSMNKFEKAAAASQKRKYPEDWVYTMKKSSKGIFEMRFTECGICKFYKKLGYADFLPYVCLIDYAIHMGLRVRLERNCTLGNGAESCNFRFIKKGKPIQGWPPNGLEEFSLK